MAGSREEKKRFKRSENRAYRNDPEIPAVERQRMGRHQHNLLSLKFPGNWHFYMLQPDRLPLTVPQIFSINCYPCGGNFHEIPLCRGNPFDQIAKSTGAKPWREQADFQSVMEYRTIRRTYQNEITFPELPRFLPVNPLGKALGRIDDKIPLEQRTGHEKQKKD